MLMSEIREIVVTKLKNLGKSDAFIEGYIEYVFVHENERLYPDWFYRFETPEYDELFDEGWTFASKDWKTTDSEIEKVNRVLKTIDHSWAD